MIVSSPRKWKQIFGPVPSRRLGRSLGVDMVPAKTCSLDCVYCEAGRTNLFTMERRAYVDASEIIVELRECLSESPALDYVTFSGAGEPTLNSGIGEIIRFLKSEFPTYKLCLLTNGSLLGDEGLIAELEGLDLIVPSLDAADEISFRKINRPCQGLTCERLIDGLVKFRKSSKTEFWLEIFVISGINSSEDSILAFRRVLERIRPDKIQLNSLDRPGAESWVLKATYSDMIRMRDAFADIAPVEIIGKWDGAAVRVDNIEEGELDARIVSIISRRPCTVADLSSVLSLPSEAIAAALGRLGDQIVAEEMERGLFYRSE